MDHNAQQQAQREYYARTADRYDDSHVAGMDVHQFALTWLAGLIGGLGIESLLDVGAGTGRALIALKAACPGLRVLGIEPSADLRAQGHAKGLGTDELIDGDAFALGFGDGEFDLVSEFGVLHHLPDPARAVAEMLRVAKEGLFISDCNNFGQGGRVGRALKQAINAAGLWRAFDRVRTRGKGYHFNEGDGLYYSYSVFNNYAQIARACTSVHVMNTFDGGTDPYRSASNVALLGLKRLALTTG